MNTSDVIREMAVKTGIPQEQVRTMVKAFTEVVAENVARGEAVTIRNFGRWSPRKRGSYYYHNPHTGAQRLIAARVRPGFKAAVRFRKRVEQTARELKY